MASNIVEEWDKVISTTYDVVESELGRGTDFVTTLARTLQVAGLFQVRHLLITLQKTALNRFYSEKFDSSFICYRTG